MSVSRVFINRKALPLSLRTFADFSDSLILKIRQSLLPRDFLIRLSEACWCLPSKALFSASLPSQKLHDLSSTLFNLQHQHHSSRFVQYRKTNIPTVFASKIYPICELFRIVESLLCYSGVGSRKELKATEVPWRTSAGVRKLLPNLHLSWSSLSVLSSFRH